MLQSVRSINSHVLMIGLNLLGMDRFAQDAIAAGVTAVLTKDELAKKLIAVIRNRWGRNPGAWRLGRDAAERSARQRRERQIRPKADSFFSPARLGSVRHENCAIVRDRCREARGAASDSWSLRLVGRRPP